MLQKMTDNRNTSGVTVGDRFRGFEFQKIVPLPEIDAMYYELGHIATGARYIHIASNDPENTFSVAFKTVPEDSTGVAHILEHTALCGSRKYPVRDPFFSMMKRSLSTFMNAFTASDWTMYPFATQNRKDFDNLMDVYLDAAFFPNLAEMSFKQEGHRLELAVPSDEPGDGQPRLEFKGVVYNEMKGAMSSPNQVMGRAILNALYPATTYHFNSGGDPVEIPSLTHAQLKAFHERHYHPSNAFFFTYGSFPLQEHLAFVEEKILNHFDRIDPRTDVPSQPRWDRPIQKTYVYPLSEDEDTGRKCQAGVAWLTSDIKDTFEVLSLSLLEQILLGNSASPLRKALIDSQLGTALSDGTGFDADNRDTLFACGLKGIAESSAEAVQDIVLNTLTDLVSGGIDPQMIESAIHQIEFQRKEIVNTPYPYGIRLLLQIGGSWFHDGHPERVLQFDADLAKLREKLENEPFFENQIKRYFLDNNHRVLLLLKPDTEKAGRDREAEIRRLAAIREQLSAEDLRQLTAEAEKLRQFQEHEEDVSSLPTLSLSDITPEIHTVRHEFSNDRLPVYIYEQATSGISYFTAAVGIGALPERLLPLVPFFCSALPRMGTAERDYSEMAQRIDLYTGGLGLSAQARTRHDSAGTCLPFLLFNAKCLVRNQEKMFDILSELSTAFSFADRQRLKNLLLEYRAALESGLIQNGHRYSMSLAARKFSLAAALNETWYGVHQLKAIKEIAAGVEDSARAEAALLSLASDLETIGKILFHRGNIQVALIGEKEALAEMRKLNQTFGAQLADGAPQQLAAPEMATPGRPELTGAVALQREGWTTSTAVSFVARTMSTVRMAHADSPALAVIGKMMRSMYLHREIREKGGAYGGFSLYSPETGQFSYASYRDPNICPTLNAFDGAEAFIRSGKYTDEDIKEAILQICSEIDKADTPGTAARKAFQRILVDVTDEARRSFKKRLLALDREQIMAAASRHFGQNAGRSAVAVISDPAKLEAANAELGDGALTLHKI